VNWTSKMRASAAAVAVQPLKPGPAALAARAGTSRTSNGLQQFLELLGDVPRARVLDLGSVWQSTISFFVDKGYRISTEDVLRGWKEFLTSEEERQRAIPSGADSAKLSPPLLMANFLEGALGYPDQNFQGILAWDLLDYFDADLVPPLMERLFRVLHPGGALLALFHSRPPERFHRYRIADSQTVELVASPTIAVHAHVFQNREILDLFGNFRSSKTFVGRDQLREALFLR